MRVVVVGGGTGLSTLLRGLKTFPCDIDAIVTITDEGGSSGILREELNVPPPGDIRNNLVALANDEDTLSQVFNYRFRNGTLSGHPVGNIILAALTKITGNFAEAVSKMSDILAIKGRVLPVSNDMARLIARFEDGSIIKGETQIVEYGKKTFRKITELKLTQPITLNPAAKEAIEKADVLVLGPGSLYTSIIANLIVEGFSQAVASTMASKIYIANIMTQPGETYNYTLKDHVQEIEKYLGTKIDYIVHSFPPMEPVILEKYRLKGSVPVENDLLETERRIIQGHFSSIVLDEDYRIRHDSLLLAKAIFELGKASVNKIVMG